MAAPDSSRSSQNGPTYRAPPQSPATTNNDTTPNQVLKEGEEEKTETRILEPEPEADSDTDSILRQLEEELNISQPPSPAKDSNDHNHSQSQSNSKDQPLSTSPTTSSLLAARKAELQAASKSASSVPKPLSTAPNYYNNNVRGLQTPPSEASLMRQTADAPAAIVLFYSSSFPTSVRMKGILSSLAESYYSHQHLSPSRNKATDDADSLDHDDDGSGGGTIFLATEADKSEWLSRRLGVRVLPCIVGYVGGQEVGRMLGFEGCRSGSKAGWREIVNVIGQWGTERGGWSGKGTIGAKGQFGSVLGRGWRDWVVSSEGGDGGAGSEDDDDDEEAQRERRRDLGFIGGIGSKTRVTGSGKSRKAADEDDDWA
jgi:hypothetical protein